MKKLFLFYLQFSVIFLHCNVNAQWKEEKLITFDKANLSNFEALQISSNGLLLVKEGIGTKSIYSLINVFTQDKKLIFETDAERSNARFNNCKDDYVIISVRKNNIWSVNIYDISGNNIITIEHPDGGVGSASIFNEKYILYQFRPFDESYASIYLYNKTKNEKKFITYGIGEQWAPNGDYFFVNTPNDENKYSNYFIFSKDGKSLLKLPFDNEHIINFKWAPDSKKLLLKKSGYVPNWGIVYIDSVDDLTVRLKNIFYFPARFTKGKQFPTNLSDPVWFNDSRTIAFIATIEDGHSILESSIYIFDEKTKKLEKVSRTYTYTSHVKSLIWNSEEDLYFIEEDKTTINIIKLNFNIK